MLVQVPLRWADLDAQGHINNSAIVKYLEEARVQFLADRLPQYLDGHLFDSENRCQRELDSRLAQLPHWGIIVADQAVDYLRSVSFTTKTITVEISVIKLSAAAFTLGYTLSQGKQVVARASSKLAIYDFWQAAILPLSPEIKTKLGALDSGFKAVPLLAPRTNLALAEIPKTAIGDYPLQLRWSEIDRYGHVNNGHFWVYIQEARIAFTESLDAAFHRSGAQGAAGYNWLIAHQDLRYLKQLPYALEPYLIRTVITRIGRSSVTLVAEISAADKTEIYAMAATVLICADKTMKPCELPNSIREKQDSIRANLK